MPDDEQRAEALQKLTHRLPDVLKAEALAAARG